jgi:parallel beta-helix repeat protein
VISILVSVSNEKDRMARGHGGRFAPARPAAVLALVALAILTSAGAASAAVNASSDQQECQAITETVFAAADSWVLENSTSNMAGDSHLLVDGKLGERSRALVRFVLPSVPAGCVVESARLRLYVLAGTLGARATAARVATAWSEFSVTWANQPAPTGSVVTAWSTELGLMPWNVTSQVQSMYSTGVNNGFLIRDAAESTELSAKHDFSSKEGGNPPELVIRFAAPPTDPPPPPAPPVPREVFCGEVITQSTLVTNDLIGCFGDGLVIGAPRIIVDLNGLFILGTGIGSGILNDGYSGVTIRNGTVQGFAHGVRLLPDSSLNVVERLAVAGNEVAGIEVGTVADTEIRDNTIYLNGVGIALVNGTTRTRVARNIVTANEETGLALLHSNGNCLEVANSNEVRGNDVRFNDIGIQLVEGSRNVIVANNASSSTEYGIALEAGEFSFDNKVEGNAASANGADGIFADGGELPGVFTITANVAFNNAFWGISALLGVIDGGGNAATNGECFGIVCSNTDTTPPNTTITSGPAATILVSSATFTFAATQWGATFQCSLDEAAFAACTSPQEVIGLTNGAHQFNVRAIDPYGNVDATPASHIWTSTVPDSTPPETTITSGPEVTTTDRSATFIFAASEAGSTFECSLDTAAFSACASPRQYTGLATGVHQFRVRATDLAGNVDATPASHNWTIEVIVDTTPPETTITSGPAGSTTATSATFSFTASEAGSTFQCSLDSPAFASCTSPQQYTGLAAGPHQFRVQATDLAGNVDTTPAIHSWTIEAGADTTPPETTITSGPAATTTASSATFAFAANEAGATFECALDTGAFASCTSPLLYTGLAAGAHQFRVRATDPAGNVDATPASHSWTIVAGDTTPPQTTITSAKVKGAKITFTFTASEAGSTFECAIDTAAFVACTSPQVVSGLPAGTHQFFVRAIDPAGNVDPTPAGHSWTTRR